MNGLIEHLDVACTQNIPARRQRKPEVIVGTMRTHATPRRWMPPMLDISVRKLTTRAKQHLLAQKTRLCMDEGHRVLQLIAEAKGTARLVVSTPCPKAARQGLVQEPTIGEHVERLVGCFNLYRAQRVRPMIRHRFERVACCGCASEAT